MFSHSEIFEKPVNCNRCNKRPIILRSEECNHGTCNECFYKICIENKYQIDSLENLEIINLKSTDCSVCNYRITKRDILMKLDESIDQKNNEKEKSDLCYIHHLEKRIFCFQCKIQMCSECFENHNTILGLVPHHKGENPENIRSLPTNSCSAHSNLPIYYYCETCESSLCEICKYVHNSEHNIGLIRDLYNKRKNEIKSEFEFYSCSREEIRKKLDESDLKLKEDLRTVVGNLKVKLNGIIDRVQQIIQGLDISTELLNGEIDINKAINNCLIEKLTQELDLLLIYPSKKFIDTNFRTIANNFYLHSKRDIKYELITEKILKTNEILNEFFSENPPNPYSDKEFLQIQISSIPTLTGHNKFITSLIQLEDGRIASGSGDNKIKIWDPENLKCLNTFTGHNGPVSCLVELQDRSLASASEYHQIKIWAMYFPFLSKSVISAVDHKTNPTLAPDLIFMIQLNDGKLAFFSSHHGMKMWDPQNNFKCTLNLPDFKYYGGRIIKLNDGKLAIRSSFENIKIINPQDNFQCIHTLKLNFSNNLKNIFGKLNKEVCLIPLKDGTLACFRLKKKWNPLNNFECTDFNFIENKFSCAVELNNGLAFGSEDGTIRIYNNNLNVLDISLIKCTNLKGHKNYVSDLILLKDGRLASASNDSTIKIWDLEEKQE